MIRRSIILLVLLSLTLGLRATAVRAAALDTVTVYYNSACGDCMVYTEETVVPLLQAAGYGDLIYRDYINNAENRNELLARSDALGVPVDLQSHLTIFVGERIVLEGHIPQHVVADLLAASDDEYERMLVYQDRHERRHRIRGVGLSR